MNETQKEERLSTTDLVDVTAKKSNGHQDDVVVAEQAESIDRPVASDTAKETNREAEVRPIALLPEDEVKDFRSRWNAIQTGFVDEPRTAVEDADSLVAETMKHLAETFAEERAGLEEQWTRGDDVSTEDLRLTLQRYRSFFHRLLTL